MIAPNGPRPVRLVLTLPPIIADRLARLAERELRGPKDQALVLLMDGLEDAGIYERSRQPLGDVEPAQAPR